MLHLDEEIFFQVMFSLFLVHCNLRAIGQYFDIHDLQHPVIVFLHYIRYPNTIH